MKSRVMNKQNNAEQAKQRINTKQAKKRWAGQGRGGERGKEKAVQGR